MAKKKLKKLLKRVLPLAALAGGAMLLNRRGKPNMDIPDRNRGMMPTGIDKVIEDVPTPNLSRMTGAGSEGGVTGQNKRANYAKRMRNLDLDTRRNNMLRAIRGTMPTPRVLDPMEQFVMDNPLDVSAKDGGRIVKGEKKAVRTKKKTRIQVRGFGKARR